MCNTHTTGSSPAPCTRCGLHEGDIVNDEATVIDPHSGLCLDCEAASACYAEEAVEHTGYEDDYLFDELGRYRPERFEGKEGSAWFGQLAAAPEPAEAQAGDHLPFNGSGHADSLEFDSTDEDGSAGAHLVDVTDLGEGGLPKAAGVIVDVTDGDGVIKYGDDDKPVIERFAENLPAGWGSNPDNPSKDEDLPLPPGVGPVVDGVKQVLPQLPGMLGDAGLGKAGARSVRRIGGGLRAGQAAQSFSDGDIAGAAKAFLRTAGRVYSPGEQKRLEEEFHPEGARNLGDLELGGTHYEGA